MHKIPKTNSVCLPHTRTNAKGSMVFLGLNTSSWREPIMKSVGSRWRRRRSFITSGFMNMSASSIGEPETQKKAFVITSATVARRWGIFKRMFVQWGKHWMGNVFANCSHKKRNTPRCRRPIMPATVPFGRVCSTGSDIGPTIVAL